MHTVETTLTLSLILFVCAVLFVSLPGMYGRVRESCAAAADAEQYRLSRDHLLTEQTVSRGGAVLPVVVSSPETVYEWIGMLDETGSLIADGIRDLAAYFGGDS